MKMAHGIIAAGLLAGLAGGYALLLHPTNGDAAELLDGESIYQQCIGCHSPDRNRTGPLHCGLFGRVAGSVEDYNYSPAMKKSKITWSRETLDHFLQAPLTAVPGTSMGYLGIKDSLERQALIDFLESLSADSPLCSSID